MKKKSLLKGFSTFALVMATSLSALAGCTNKATEPIKPVNPIPENPGGEIVTPVEEKVTAYEVANSLVSSANLEGSYDNAIQDLVKTKYSKVEKIKSVSIDKKANGKFTIVANIKDENNQTKEVTLEYEGDTRNVYSKETNADILAQILAKADIELDTEFVKDSQTLNEFKTLVSAEVSSKLAQINALKNIILTEKQQAVEPQVEYISVQSIVDEIWGNIDTDADIKAIAKYLTETKRQYYNYEKELAIDMENNSLNFYIKMTSKTNSKDVHIMKFDVATDENIENFYEFVKGKDSKVQAILGINNDTLTQKLVKDSNEERALRNVLSGEKQQYNQTKGSLTSLSKSEINAESIFAPNLLSDAQMQELGIQDMNSFARALQTNTRGTGYDKVSGWTMDDVVGTFVGETTTNNLSHLTGYHINVLSKNGIFDYHVSVLYGVEDVAYNKLLINSDDVTILNGKKLAEYSDNAIVYDREGSKKQIKL